MNPLTGQFIDTETKEVFIAVGFDPVYNVLGKICEPPTVVTIPASVNDMTNEVKRDVTGNWTLTEFNKRFKLHSK